MRAWAPLISPWARAAWASERAKRAFQTGEELAGLLADGRKVRDCYARQWFRNSVGRIEMPEDACSVATLQQAFEDSGGDLRGLLLAVTQLDTFLYRRAPE